MAFITLPLPLFRKRPAEVEELRARQLARVRRLLPSGHSFFNLERLSLERLTAIGDKLEQHTRAKQKALTLLRFWLSPEQIRQFDENSYFEVIGCDTGTRYHIHHGRMLNIVALDAAGREAQRLCFGPEGQLAIGDIMLAQKIALETMERAVLAIANVHPLTSQFAAGDVPPILEQHRSRYVNDLMMVIAAIGFFCALCALAYKPLR